MEEQKNLTDVWEKQEIQSKFWLPMTEKEELIGQITDIVQGKFGLEYVVKTSDGKKVQTKAHKNLQLQMADATVGTYVKIIFMGMKQDNRKGRNPSFEYSVYFRKGQETPVHPYA